MEWHVLGVDPAKTGGAALLNQQGRLVLLWFWLQCTRNGLPAYKMVTVGLNDYSMHICRSLHEVGTVIEAQSSFKIGCNIWNVVSENTFVHNNLITTLSLARTQGMILGPLQERAPLRHIVFLQPTEWRKRLYPAKWNKAIAERHGIILSKRNKPKRKEDRGRVEKLAALYYLPQRLPELDGMLDRLATTLGIERERVADAAEACGVALGWLHGE